MRDYDVGYGKPPTRYQYKPGQSGNPRGRPRRPSSYRSFNAYLARALRHRIPFQVGRSTKMVTMTEAIAFGVVMRAAQGDQASLKLLSRQTDNFRIDFTPDDGVYHRISPRTLDAVKRFLADAESYPEESAEVEKGSRTED